jgi:hypothetical protein
MSQPQDPSAAYGQDPSQQAGDDSQQYGDDQGGQGAEGGEYGEGTYEGGYEEEEAYGEEDQEGQDGQAQDDGSAGQYGPQANGYPAGAYGQQDQKAAGAAGGQQRQQPGGMHGTGAQKPGQKPGQQPTKPGQQPQKPQGGMNGQKPGQGQRPGQGGRPQPNGSSGAMVPRGKGTVTHGGPHASQMQRGGGAGGATQDWTLTNSEGHHAANDGAPIMGPHGHKVFASHLPHASHQQGVEALNMIYRELLFPLNCPDLERLERIGYREPDC